MMRFAITGEHRQFFQKQQALELEGMCSLAQLKAINASIDSVIAERIGVRGRLLDNQSPASIFAAGRDSWRSNDVIRRFITQPSLADIAAELTEKRTLRLGYDQFFPSPITSVAIVSGENPYGNFLSRIRSLEEVSSLQGLVCGLMLCLNGRPKTDEQEQEKEIQEKKTKDKVKESDGTDLVLDPINIFADHAGDGIFFSGQTPINWERLLNLPNHRYIMIVFVQNKSVYVFNESDPQGYSLKQWGYTFGDKLSDKLNPIVRR